jgi:hypothetical protein
VAVYKAIADGRLKSREMVITRRVMRINAEEMKEFEISRCARADFTHLLKESGAFETVWQLSRAFPLSGEKVSQAKRGSPKVVDIKVSRTAGVVSEDWL